MSIIISSCNDPNTQSMHYPLDFETKHDDFQYRQHRYLFWCEYLWYYHNWINYEFPLYGFIIGRDQTTYTCHINNYGRNYYYLMSWYDYCIFIDVDVFITLGTKLAKQSYIN